MLDMAFAHSDAITCNCVLLGDDLQDPEVCTGTWENAAI